jgi:hypothetical protein
MATKTSSTRSTIAQDNQPVSPPTVEALIRQSLELRRIPQAVKTLIQQRDKALRSLSAEAQDELLALGILERRIQETQDALQRRQERVIELLVGTELSAGFFADLLRLHNERAAKAAQVRP